LVEYLLCGAHSFSQKIFLSTLKSE
jgi:hypothetical protein